MGFFDFMERAAVAPRQFSTNVTQNSFNDFDFPPPVSILRPVALQIHSHGSGSISHHASYFVKVAY
jgi:hypothetical protein